MNPKKSCLIWLTGLSGSGKTTIGLEFIHALQKKKVLSTFLDADLVRQGLNRDLGFSPQDRQENIRRVGEVAKLFVEAGLVTIAAFISPYNADREKVRALFAPEQFCLVYLNCPLAVCEQRDPKGLYLKARSHKLPDFTGVSAPYEEPKDADLVLNTDHITVAESVRLILQKLNF